MTGVLMRKRKRVRPADGTAGQAALLVKICDGEYFYKGHPCGNPDTNPCHLPLGAIRSVHRRPPQPMDGFWYNRGGAAVTSRSRHAGKAQATQLKPYLELIVSYQQLPAKTWCNAELDYC